MVTQAVSRLDSSFVEIPTIFSMFISLVPVWSGVNVAGVALRELHPGVGSDDDTTEFNKIHHLVVNSGAEVIKRKGYTSWAIGLSVASIARAILHNSHNICAVSTLVTVS